MSICTLTKVNGAFLCIFALALWITAAAASWAAEPGEEGHTIALCFDYELVEGVARATDAGRDDLATSLFMGGVEAGECVVFEVPVRVTLERLERPSDGRYRFDIWAARWHGLAVYVTAEPAGART